MAREKELFGANMEALNKAFPDKFMLNMADVTSFTGVSRQSAKKFFHFTEKCFITKTQLARDLCV